MWMNSKQCTELWNAMWNHAKKKKKKRIAMLPSIAQSTSAFIGCNISTLNRIFKSLQNWQKRRRRDKIHTWRIITTNEIWIEIACVESMNPIGLWNYTYFLKNHTIVLLLCFFPLFIVLLEETMPVRWMRRTTNTQRSMSLSSINVLHIKCVYVCVCFE